MIVLDTETTGFCKPQVIELAYQALDGNFIESDQGFYCQRFKPSKQIEAGAFKTHGISEKHLTDMPPSQQILTHAPTILSAKYIIGHHIDYDINAINETTGEQRTFKTICTKRLAFEVFKNLPSYSLVNLCDGMGVVDHRIIDNAHSADADVHMTVKLLQRIVCALKETTGKDYSADDLFALYQSLPKMLYSDYKKPMHHN